MSAPIMGPAEPIPSAVAHIPGGRRKATTDPEKCDPFVKSKQLLERVFDT
jgi:hypothetical protein